MLSSVRNRKGFTLIELMIVLAIIGILALIAIPNFISLREKAYDASAQSAGRNAKLAEEVYYNDRFISGGAYAGDLDSLLTYNKNLADDASVTFTFSTADSSGYTITTQHASSGNTFVFTD